MEYQIIPMTPAQLPQAVALERACFSHPWTEKALAEDLDNELLTLLAAVGEDGTLLGYGEVRTVLDEGTLERIAVAPQFRRHGAAEALLRRFWTTAGESWPSSPWRCGRAMPRPSACTRSWGLRWWAAVGTTTGRRARTPC